MNAVAELRFLVNELTDAKSALDPDKFPMFHRDRVLLETTLKDNKMYVLRWIAYHQSAMPLLEAREAAKLLAKHYPTEAAIWLTNQITLNQKQELAR